MRNSVRELTQMEVSPPGRAVLVYGIRVEGPWDAPRFAVDLDEYSVQDQAGLGSCFSFNRTVASVPSAPGSLQYFAFDVPAGYYTYSAFRAADLAGGEYAFRAEKGRAAYVGEFIFTAQRKVELRRDGAGLARASHALFGRDDRSLSLAEAVAVRPAKMFLCMP